MAYYRFDGWQNSDGEGAWGIWVELDDDCYELTILRRFRDEWLSKQDGGRSDIAQYYSFAPSVVNRIDSLPNRLDIYQTIYEELVAPCVEMIEQGRRLDAWQLYKQYSRDLIAQYSAQTA